MVRLLLIFNGILLFSLFVGSCYTYRPIKISSIITLRESVTGNDFTSERASEKGDDGRRVPDGMIQGNEIVPKVKKKDAADKDINLSEKRNYRFYIKKYFALSHSFSPLDRINNKGVEYSLNGRFKEAAILFREVLRENENSGAALNNLGIIYELFGYYNSAFTMYSRACLLEPGNRYFRRNFLFFKRSRAIRSE